MIVFDLACDNAHRFEGWFRSTGDFEDQQAHGLIACPNCGSEAVTKAPMAPAVPVKGNRAVQRADCAAPKRNTLPQAMANQPMPPELAKAFAKIAEAQAKALHTSEWVGDRFADEVRSMHYGEKTETLVHGRATGKDARELLEEGIAVAPLLVPIAPPDEVN